jgi:hypothetical protein
MVRETKLLAKENYCLKVFTCGDSFSYFEAYLYEHGPNNDGFTQPLRELCSGVIQNERLSEMGFSEIKHRRVTGSKNLYSLGRKGYKREIMIRYLGNNKSTPESRREGLQALKEFLLNPVYTKFPPKGIDMEDITNEDLIPLDQHFMDDTVEYFMKIYLDQSTFGADFFKKFPGFAAMCWHGPHESQFAESLGFPKYDIL